MVIESLRNINKMVDRIIVGLKGNDDLLRAGLKSPHQGGGAVHANDSGEDSTAVARDRSQQVRTQTLARVKEQIEKI